MQCYDMGKDIKYDTNREAVKEKLNNYVKIKAIEISPNVNNDKNTYICTYTEK